MTLFGFWIFEWENGEKSGRAEFFFDFLDGGEVSFEILGEFAGDLVFGDADGLGHAAQGIFGDEAFLVLAKDETDAGLVIGMALLIVDHVEVEIHFGRVFRFECAAFQINDDEAAELQVIEEEVQIEIVITEFEVDLTTNEGEAGAELDEEFAQVLDQSEFQVAFPRPEAEGEEAEMVGILDDLLREIGLRIGQGVFEVGDGLAVALVGCGFDLEGENAARSAVFEGLHRIPEAGGGVLDLLD